MRLSRTDLVPVLAIILGGAVGVVALGGIAVSAVPDRIPAVSLLDEHGSLRNGVTGTWILGVDLGRNGSGNARFVLEQEGSIITGTYSGARGSRLPVTGTVEDGTVKLFFASSAGLISYEGTIEGITMEGTCDSADSGEGTFRGNIRS